MNECNQVVDIGGPWVCPCGRVKGEVREERREKKRKSSSSLKKATNYSHLVAAEKRTERKQNCRRGYRPRGIFSGSQSTGKV